MIGKYIIENGIKYDYLCLDHNKTSKLSRTQIKRTWRKFVKDKEYSKVEIFDKRISDNVPINEIMYFKNGKLHNEFNWSVETEILSTVERLYYLDGKKMTNFDETSWPEFVINWRRFNILKETLGGDIIELE